MAAVLPAAAPPPAAPPVSAASAGPLRREPAGVSPLERLEIELFMEAVYRHYGFDFREYAKSSLLRRLRKRMEAEGIATISALQDRVLHDAACMDRLLKDLSVSVTAMFRDPSFFLAFRREVVPLLRTYPFIRIWHAGCATGEEVYAMAILLREEGLEGRARIYATDMNAGLVRAAKQGIFPVARMQEYTNNYLHSGGTGTFSSYYTAKYDGALFDPDLVKNVLFTQHNLAADRSFAEFNVILCRNVLIYFNPDLKNRSLALFMESLATFGVLALGKKESLRFTAVEEHFEPLCPAEKIFRRIA